MSIRLMFYVIFMSGFFGLIESQYLCAADSSFHLEAGASGAADSSFHLEAGASGATASSFHLEAGASGERIDDLDDAIDLDKLPEKRSCGMLDLSREMHELILSFCDVSTVLRVRQSCRALYHASFASLVTIDTSLLKQHLTEEKLVFLLNTFWRLKRLTLVGNQLSPQLFIDIARQAPKIDRLVVANCLGFLPSETLQALDSEDAPELSICEFQLTNIPQFPDGDMARLLDKMPRLASLNMRAGLFLGFKTRQALLRKAGLRQLNVDYYGVGRRTPFPATDLVRIATNNQNLESLSIEEAHVESKEQLVELLRQCPNLKSFRSNCEYLNEVLLENPTLCPKLEILEVSGCGAMSFEVNTLINFAKCHPSFVLFTGHDLNRDKVSEEGLRQLTSKPSDRIKINAEWSS